jgi:hypothetical protein
LVVFATERVGVAIGVGVGAGDTDSVVVSTSFSFDDFGGGAESVPTPRAEVSSRASVVPAKPANEVIFIPGRDAATPPVGLVLAELFFAATLVAHEPPAAQVLPDREQAGPADHSGGALEWCGCHLPGSTHSCSQAPASYTRTIGANASARTRSAALTVIGHAERSSTGSNRPLFGWAPACVT